MVKRLKENRKRGVTLVELIVVLVILAVLVAISIPALTGYIDKAKEKQIILETRQLVMASQTLLDEEYAKFQKNSNLNPQIIVSKETTGIDNNGNFTISTVDIKELAEIEVTADTFKATLDENGKIDTVEYKEGNKTCTYSSADKEYNVQ